MTQATDAPATTAPAVTVPAPRLIKRHSALVRATHWVNALCLIVLLMSGLQIFNAHPALYVGSKSDFSDPVFAIDSREVNGRTEGYTALLGHSVNTTGVLGLSNSDGQPTERAFPSWLTLPSNQDLETGRHWHFVMAWLLVVNGTLYLLYGLFSRHFARHIVPTGGELAHTGQAVVDHIKLRFPHGENARGYNVLQKLTYFAVIFVALPLIVLAGWTMSPGLDAAFPFLTTLLGGRQTARTIHFVVAWGLVAFFVVHIAMVLLTGVFNNMRSMITGWFDTGEAKDGEVTTNA